MPPSNLTLQPVAFSKPRLSAATSGLLPEPALQAVKAQVLLAQPRGFCAGVVRAIDIVERALELYGAPVYVHHEIVHNGHVVQMLRERGAVFVDSVDDIPLGAPTVFSAHGVSHAVVARSAARGLQVIDATCPLVSKVHQQVQRYAQQGRAVLVIGHPGHQEVIGTLGRVPGARLVSSVAEVQALQFAPDAPLAYVTQTTLSLDDTRDIIAALHERFADLQGPDTDDICYATQNRQAAVRALAAEVDVVFIVGANNSSNSARLREVAQQAGVPAFLVADESGVDPAWLRGARRIGVGAGASTPEVLVQRVVQRLREWGAGPVVQLPGLEERISFRLPLALIERAA